ncbi:MAG: HD-GYP domain-containing protein [Eubacteriales bacterium]|nr:HD-GYP domain-containing protein [Eubacteriales bacterium]
MNKNGYEINYDKWGHVTLVSQLLIAGFVFLTEVLNNALLYVTRSQGYGPETIVGKLIRYLFLTTLINFGLILISQFIVRKTKDNMKRRLILMIATILICTDVAFSHYQFAVTLVIFVIPVMISILYEDFQFLKQALFMSLIGQTIAVIARASDSLYNKDIGPEAAIAYTFTISIFIFARIILNTLLVRREELGEALVSAEKMNAAEERVQLSLKMLETLARALDAKDKYTNGHSARVAVYSTKLAKELRWDDAAIENLKFEALLHDIGKIGVPDSILNKPDRLSETEFNLIKSHSLIGADILKDMAALPNSKYVAKYHHERYDGTGYPSGIGGVDIPLNARIVCIADAYDAMSSDRIYRKALPNEVIREELVKGRGTQFDPELLDIFLKLFDEQKLSVRVNTSHMTENNSEHRYVMDDIDHVIHNITQLEQKSDSVKYFDKFYIYMRNIGMRYNRSIEVMSIILKTKQNDKTEVEEDAAQAMETAIKKNIRAVDVYFRHSVSEHLIIFLDAGVENIDVIAQRIMFEFQATKYKDQYEILYKLNEDV